VTMCLEGCLARHRNMVTQRRVTMPPLYVLSARRPGTRAAGPETRRANVREVA